jgi:hypothetical protein
MTTRTVRKIPEMWQKLMSTGWVNVTGLTVSEGPGNFYRNPFDFIFPLANAPEGTDHMSGLGFNNDMWVAYLPDGTVWLHASSRALAGARDMPFQPEFTGNAFVPCSNKEQLDGRQILERIADPFWNGGKVYDKELREEVHVHYPATIEELREHPSFIKYRRKIDNCRC